MFASIKYLKWFKKKTKIFSIQKKKKKKTERKQKRWVLNKLTGKTIRKTKYNPTMFAPKALQMLMLVIHSKMYKSYWVVCLCDRGLREKIGVMTQREHHKIFPSVRFGVYEKKKKKTDGKKKQSENQIIIQQFLLPKTKALQMSS